ncbi:MAG: adenosylcobinamide-GDP ribazoletransferase [Pseudomonadota bacterium]
MQSILSFPFDLYRTLRFATRLPLPLLEREKHDAIVAPDRFATAFPVCGWVVALIGGGLAGLLMMTMASPVLAIILAVAAMTIATGALHEDGLADFADGIGGGRTRERKLDIMRDPALGSYGALALLLCVGTRIASLVPLAMLHPWLPCAALLAAHGTSRASAMMLASILPQARAEGAAARLGKPTKRAAAASFAIAGIGTMAALTVPLDPLAAGVVTAATMLSAAAAAGSVGVLASRYLGGQTGDVLGAAQQLSELAGMIILSIWLPKIF